MKRTPKECQPHVYVRAEHTSHRQNPLNTCDVKTSLSGSDGPGQDTDKTQTLRTPETRKSVSVSLMPFNQLRFGTEFIKCV